MKKFLLTIVASVLIAGNVMAQGVARECVLIEAFTGIGCGFCPAAAQGIAMMLEEGLSIAPLAFHNSYYSPPEYATAETNGRATYYSVQAFPTVMIDGMIRMEGGGTASQGQTQYNKYKPHYDERINVLSPFSIDLSFDYHSGTQCQVKAVVNKVADCDGNDVRLFIALTESHIQQQWGGLSELNAVVRDIVTSSSGVEIKSDSQEITELFSVAGYKKENLQLIAWVQNYNGSREVYQAVKLSIADALSQYDLGITKIEEVSPESCSGMIKPRMTFRNYGSETITSATFNIVDGTGTELGNEEWTGTLPKGMQTEIIFDEIDFGETGSVRIELLNLNGNNADEYSFDNIYLYDASTPYNLPDGYMKLQLKTGDNPITVDIMDMDSQEVIQSYSFSEPNKMYQEEYTFTEYGCYRVVMKSANGAGIGNGFWGVKDADKETVIMGSNTENAFRYEFPFELMFSEESIADTYKKSNVVIYPNPASELVNISADNLSEISVYNASGQLVYSEKTENTKVVIDVNTWTTGLYYISVETKNGIRTSQKIIVK
ncbi:MAG: T9SS type A sorting domain-containing protein [Bacteroidales bacterium]|nr:T9SS type A sorting domain-containing protein [Bacteroidales bacterium]MBQ8223024.1 T9SS type A sorting domain-containing protein [Bacteroidales bacterium]